MSYLVTGGAGFIGSHVAQALLQRGEKVVVLDNLDSYYDVAIKQRNLARLHALHRDFVMVQGDVRDSALIAQLFNEHRFTHVAHLAGMAGVRFSMTQAPLYLHVNLNGTMNLLEASRDFAVKQFVFASTSSVYGKTAQVPFVETDSADQPLAPYPASKRSAEILAHAYHNLFGLQFTALRFFNVYGAEGRPDMMPLRLLNAALDQTPIDIFGDGSLKRDWTYIQDTVDGVLSALARPLGYQVINLGYGNPVSLNDFIGIIERLTQRKIVQRHVPTPPSEPPVTYCNNQKARDLLGFAPQTDLETGLRYTWEWLKRERGLS